MENALDWALMPLRRYADFSGRSRRREYWLYAAMIIVAFLFLSMIVTSIFGYWGFFGGLGRLIIRLCGLLVLVPSLAVQARRFHDQDKSGWLVLLNLIPFVGSLVVLVFMCLEGTRGPNRYGGDPKLLPGTPAY